jgi:glycosyltransferase involved in cell wall biosynthesis
MASQDGPRRRVVWCSAHYWQSAVQVSAHQHARQLARQGWDVLFLSTPVTPFHLAGVPRSEDHRARFAAWHRRGRPDGAEPGITAYTPMTVAPLSSVLGLRYDRVLRGWQHATVPPLSRYLARHGFGQPDLLVVDTPLYRFLFDGVDARQSVYRITDYNPGFRSATPRLAQLEAEALARADVVLYTAPELAEHVNSMHPRRSALVANGVDLAGFSSPQPMPREYHNIPGPRAVYVGSLREWFDFALLETAARKLPGVSFVVIGPDHWARKRLPRLTNVHVLGQRPHDQVPGYLQHADVGLIPFDRARTPELVDAINPLKLYEYAAAGLPVVATDWRALRQLASPAILASTRDAFVAGIRKALQDQVRLSAEGRNWVAGHSWHSRSRDLLHALRLE